MPTNVNTAVIPLTERKKRLKKHIDQKRLLAKKVLAELKQETGIDYVKLLTGDEREKRRAKFQDYQDALIR